MPFVEILTELLLKLPSPITKLFSHWMLEKLKPRITLRMKDSWMDVDASAELPCLHFHLKFDNKAPIDFRVEQIITYVYMNGVLMDKISWNRLEKVLHEALERSPFVTGLTVDRVGNLKALKEAWITLHCTPPLYTFKSKFASKWTLFGIIEFSCKIGKLRKTFTCDLELKKSRIKEVLDKYEV